MRLCLTFLFLIGVLFSQNSFEKCGIVNYQEYLNNEYPGFNDVVEATFNQAKAHASKQHVLKSTNSTPDTIYRIPVVFHIVYNGANQNVEDSLLYNQIDVLNQDFRRLNADTTNTRAIFKDRAGDVGFEFHLATIDPDGNPTNGITRTSTSATFSFFDLDAMKSNATGGKDAWNTLEYLNIWVCDLGGFVLGFAYPPTAAPNWPAGQTPTDPNLDGVVIHYEVIGRNNPRAVGQQLSIADRGRTAVHEIGHFFGLRHIWGDAGGPFGGNDCDINQDDGFEDTPHMGSNSQQTGCVFSKNSCMNGEQPDEPDMVENYMDYSTETCQNMFTQQQADLMRSMAVIGRPTLPHVIQNDTFLISEGTWIVVNQTDTIQITSSNSYTYSVGDEVMILNENNAITYSALDNGELSVSSDFYATEESTFSTTEVNVNIKENFLEKITIYPNPAKNKLEISSLLKSNCSEVQLYDLTGKLLSKHKVLNDNITINTTEINNGVYILNFVNENVNLGFRKLSILK